MFCHKGVEPVRHDTPAELRGVVLLPTPALHMPVYAPGATEGETVYLRRGLWLAFGGQDRLVHHVTSMSEQPHVPGAIAQQDGHSDEECGLAPALPAADGAGDVDHV